MDDALARWAARQGVSEEALAELRRILTPHGGTSVLATFAESTEAPRPAPDHRYEPRAPIGVGGQGEVWRAWDHRLARSVAMKRLRPELAHDPHAAARLHQEALLTARVEHPGVVPVYDLGAAADGQPYLIVREATEGTLADLLRRSDIPLRRLLDVLGRVAEAVAAAHDRGVVHRDLKPRNIGVGPRGEVLVLDWGLAAPAGARPDSDGGTPPYRAPEQQGAAPPDPRADVYSLGVMLREILTGQRPVIDETPMLHLEDPLLAPLVALCQDALQPDPQARPPHAGAVADRLRDWLDGAHRRAQATQHLAAAQAQIPQILSLRAESGRRYEAAATTLRMTLHDRPVADKVACWAEQDEARALDVAASVLESEVLRALHAARSLAPELPAVDEALADLYKSQVELAEHTRDAQAARLANTLLDLHDRAGRYAAFRAGTGRLTLHTSPAGATVHLDRVVERGRRLVREPLGMLGVTPLDAAPLAPGSYVLTLTHPGYAPLTYPVCIGRFEHWDGVPPEGGSPQVIPLVPDGVLGPDDVVVPAGWFQSGDWAAKNSLPPRRVWVDGFVVRRHPITNAEYLAFLNDQIAQGREEEATLAVPETEAYQRDTDGRFRLGADRHGDLWSPRWPVVRLREAGVRAFFRWVRLGEAPPWRLPNALELEKAGRGVDGRIYPWGDTAEPTWANCSLPFLRQVPKLTEVGLPPEDSSVYGVHGLAGNARDRTLNLQQEENDEVSPQGLAQRHGQASPARNGIVVFVGGSYGNPIYLNRVASRWYEDVTTPKSFAGIRLARSWPERPLTRDPRRD